jgi:hypothetical protein
MSTAVKVHRKFFVRFQRMEFLVAFIKVIAMTEASALVKAAHLVVLVILSFLFLVVSMAISEFFTSSALDPGAPDRGPR